MDFIVVIMTIAELRDRLYRGPVRSIVRQLNLEDPLYGLYCRALIITTDGVLERTVANTSTQFHISTREEVSFFESLGGESAVFEDLLPRLQADDTFLDIGAHIGLYTCYVGNRVIDGELIAVEPDPANVSRLMENLDLNGLEATVVEKAISDEEDEIVLDTDPRKISLLQTDTEQPMRIQTTSVDSLVRHDRIPTPSVVKMDIDGGELDALRGMKNQLDNIRLLYCEVHPAYLRDRGQSADTVYDLLADAGFKITEILDEKGTDQIVTTVRAEREGETVI